MQLANFLSFSNSPIYNGKEICSTFIFEGNERLREIDNWPETKWRCWVYNESCIVVVVQSLCVISCVEGSWWHNLIFLRIVNPCYLKEDKVRLCSRTHPFCEQLSEEKLSSNSTLKFSSCFCKWTSNPRVQIRFIMWNSRR